MRRIAWVFVVACVAVAGAAGAAELKLRPGERRGGAMAARQAGAAAYRAGARAGRPAHSAAPQSPAVRHLPQGSPAAQAPIRAQGYRFEPPAPPPSEPPKPSIAAEFLERVAEKHQRQALSGELGTDASGKPDPTPPGSPSAQPGAGGPSPTVVVVTQPPPAGEHNRDQGGQP